MKIQGLDTWGIDPQNIKIVDVDSLDAEEEEEPTLLGLKRLKIVGLCRQQKDFKTSECYSEKFKKKYTAEVKYTGCPPPQSGSQTACFDWRSG